MVIAAVAAVSGGKLPQSLGPELACEACNATIVEGAKRVAQTKHRLGKAQDVSAVMALTSTGHFYAQHGEEALHHLEVTVHRSPENRRVVTRGGVDVRHGEEALYELDESEK